jgi:DNA-binding response OmpR family regulator
MNSLSCDAAPVLDVLLVDDDHGDLASFGLAANETDGNIWLQTVSSAEQAMEYLRSNGKYADRKLHPIPDLLILDLHQEGMAGFGFLTWRMKSPRIPKMPVLFLCTPRDERATGRALRLKADGYFPRPECFEEWMALARLVWAVGMIHSR